MDDDGAEVLGFKPTPSLLKDSFTDASWLNQISTSALHRATFQHHFEQLIKAAELGYGKAFSAASDVAEWELFQRMQQNMARFSAAKQLRMNEELQLLRTNNPTWTEAKWREKAQSVFSRHDNYLRAELLTANASASMAESWRVFQERKELYPNLKYITAHDDRVRPLHRKLGDVIYPVDHPFWDTFYPPNGWRCRCTVIQTDEAENPISLESHEKADKGFRHNVGKTGKLFSDEHPYFDWSEQQISDLFKEAEVANTKYGRQIVKEWTKANVQGTSFTLPDGNKTTLSGRDISSWVSHDIPNAPAKNNMLYILQMILDIASFHTAAPNHKPEAKPLVTQYLYYKVLLLGHELYIMVEEMRDGSGKVYKIYGVSGSNVD